MDQRLEPFIVEMEDLADRAYAAGFHVMAASLMINVRCARQFDRNVWQRLLTIAFTAIELCGGKR